MKVLLSMRQRKKYAAATKYNRSDFKSGVPRRHNLWIGVNALIDHLITKPLMFSGDAWTHTLQHAFRKLQSGFLVTVLSINYSKSLLTSSDRCISVGTKKGYSITNCDPFGRVYTMSAYILSLSSVSDMRYRWWCSRDSWDAILYIPHCPRRCRGSTTVQSSQTPDCQHKGMEIIFSIWSRHNIDVILTP